MVHLNLNQSTDVDYTCPIFVDWLFVIIVSIGSVHRTERERGYACPKTEY